MKSIGPGLTALGGRPSRLHIGRVPNTKPLCAHVAHCAPDPLGDPVREPMHSKPQPETPSGARTPAEAYRSPQGRPKVAAAERAAGQCLARAKSRRLTRSSRSLPAVTTEGQLRLVGARNH